MGWGKKMFIFEASKARQYIKQQVAGSYGRTRKTLMRLRRKHDTKWQIRDHQMKTTADSESLRGKNGNNPRGKSSHVRSSHQEGSAALSEAQT